jgi:hypothetical protein
MAGSSSIASLRSTLRGYRGEWRPKADWPFAYALAGSK